jgi:hypothetical protein
MLLRFNEPLDRITAETIADYSVDGGIGAPIAATLESDTTVLLQFSHALAPNVVYTVSVWDVEDTQGNPIVIDQDTLSFRILEVSITEIMYNNRGTDIEWIELYNTTGGTVDLSGWYISDDNVYPATGEGACTLPPGTTIGSGEYLIVNLWDNVNFGNWQMPQDIAVVDAVVSATGALGNGGDNIALYDSATDGTLMDGSLTVEYPDLSQDGASIEKIDEFFPWGDEDTIVYNFRRCMTPVGFETGTSDAGGPLSGFATPGRANGKTLSDSASVDTWLLYRD